MHAHAAPVLVALEHRRAGASEQTANLYIERQTPRIPQSDTTSRRASMEDLPYDPQSILAAQRPIFEQLASSFPEYEVWQRHEDFHRWLSAGVVNRATRAAATVIVVRGGHARTQLLTVDELIQLRKHLASEQDKDLSI